jgi:phospholipid/cholesterol/gamma-HCH transport system substrate-binding protein
MKISYRARPTVWLVVVLLFLASVGAVFSYLWTNSGGTVPFLTKAGYSISFPVKDADNVVYYSDVRMAGVKIGKVTAVDNQPQHAVLTIELDNRVAPLHQGATIRIGAKSLVEESYVGVTDGTGPPLRSGAMLPAESVIPSVQLDQVLDSLDPGTRAALGSTIRSLGAGTTGRASDIGSFFSGLGGLGHGGATAMRALAAQSKQLESLSANTTVLLDALDTQNGDIARLVHTGQEITAATEDGRADIEATMRETPGVLHSASVATDKLTELSAGLGPVARDLKEASPLLSAALTKLPDVSRDLRASLPPLDGVLSKVPETLDRVPHFSKDTSDLVPPARDVLADLNPALAYLQPYGPDIAAFFTNFGSWASQGNQDGKWARVSLIFSEQSLRNYPVSTNIGPLNRSNAYPAAGSSGHPYPFTGIYPRVQREGH